MLFINFLFWILWTCLTFSIKVCNLIKKTRQMESWPVAAFKKKSHILHLTLSWTKIVVGCKRKDIESVLQETKTCFSEKALIWNLSLMFICMQKVNSISDFFFEILSRFANLLLWVLWECFIMLINNDSITLQETLVPKVLQSACNLFDYLHAKNQLHL